MAYVDIGVQMVAVAQAARATYEASKSAILGQLNSSFVLI